MTETSSTKWDDITRRTITALVGAPSILAIVYVGSPWLDALILAVVVIMALEFHGALRLAGRTTRAYVLATFACMVLGVAHGVVWCGCLLALAVVLALAHAYRQGGGWRRLVVYPLLAGVYIGGGMGWLLALRDGPNGAVLLTMLLLNTWGTDTAALFVGRWLGKRPIAPRISPKKSLEGVLGGFALGVTAGVLFGLWGGLGLGVALAANVGLSLATTLGDLVMSSVKRGLDVKDMGRLLPGHGGMVDRLDGLILAAILAQGLVLAGVL